MQKAFCKCLSLTEISNSTILFYNSALYTFIHEKRFHRVCSPRLFYYYHYFAVFITCTCYARNYVLQSTRPRNVCMITLCHKSVFWMNESCAQYERICRNFACAKEKCIFVFVHVYVVLHCNNYVIGFFLFF